MRVLLQEIFLPIASGPVADAMFKKPKVCQNDNPLVKTVSILANFLLMDKRKRNICMYVS